MVKSLERKVCDSYMIGPELLAKLRLLSGTIGLSKSELIRRAIRRYLKQVEKEGDIPKCE